MSKYLRLQSILTYVLSIVVGFILGAFLPTLTGTVEKTGMAGGATVVISGMIAALIGLIAAIVVISRCTSKTIHNINWVLTAMLVILVTIMIGPHVVIG